MARPPAPASAAPVRFEELEGYRGVAALLVVVFHAYQYSREGTGSAREVYADTPLHLLFHNLEVGVAWFFVLSGFLLFLPFARAALTGGGAPSIRGFLLRRALRILPAYYLAIVGVWALRYDGGDGQWLDLLQHLTFTHIFDRAHIFWTIGPAWSLAVEVIFYIFLAGFGPLIVHAAHRLAAPRARAALLVGAIGALAAGSLAYRGWAALVARAPATDFPIYFGPAALFHTLAFGMLLAVAVALAPPRAPTRPWAGWLRLAGLALLAGAFALRTTEPLVDLYFAALSGLAFLCVLASTALGGRDSRWARALGRPTLQGLGLISYSLYLWHEPLLISLGERGLLIRQSPEAFPWNALGLVLVSIAVATASYWAVERPALELSHLFTRTGALAERYATPDVP